MPIPFLLAGLGLAAGAIGIGGHIEAKDTNEKAQRISREAQELYEEAQESLENSQEETKNALLELGISKKDILEGSVSQFLQAYERIKNIKLNDSVGINEISKFEIDQEEVLQLREMSGIYQSVISSGIAGAATGSLIALAASGTLPFLVGGVTGGLTVAGSCLAVGELGLAAGTAGSALLGGLTTGIALTPFAAVAAPVVFFTGISSSIKADENLEKAQTMYAEAEAAAEKMMISERMCDAIGERAEMFNDLLEELDGMFLECVQSLDNMTKEKIAVYGKNRIDAKVFTREELKLVAVTRALAGAVKAVIDIPILNEEGTLSNKSEIFYCDTIESLSDFASEVDSLGL